MRIIIHRKLAFSAMLFCGIVFAALPVWASGSKEASSSTKTANTAMSSSSGAKVSLLETGSSLLYPLFNLWVPAYASTHSNVQITTQSTGSGTGIAMATNGSAQIGASDAYLSDALMKKNPGMLNIPLAISAQQINYNVPGLNDKHLKLSGPVLAGIYGGKITYWDDPAIAKINPGVTLPHHTIVPVHRTDGSGDTFIFTQFLSDSTPQWKGSIGAGLTVSWPPVQGGIGAEGNPGMVQAIEQNPYSLAYIGISWLDQATKAGMGEAMLQNRAGNFVLPDETSVKAAAAAMFKNTPKDERISLIYAPGAGSYPIINYEYAIIQEKQPNSTEAAALKTFLTWALSSDGGGSASYLNKVHFQPLPASVSRLSMSQVQKIAG